MIKINLSILLLLLLSFSSNTTIAQADKKPSEKLVLKVDTAQNLISYSKLLAQSPFSLQEREQASRGILSDLIIPKGIQAVQSLINNRQKKFTTNYSFATSGESFYDQISTLGPFDATGILFKGFTVTRMLTKTGSASDTVFIAKFILDTSQGRQEQIMNNGMFVMRLDSLVIKKPKVKITKHKNRLNLDFEITFVSSYLGENDQMNKDVPVGKFVCTVRNAPLDPNEVGYANYYDSLAKKKPYCSGQSFVVPRSMGFYRNETGGIDKCYGKGIYSISVSVKESSVSVKESQVSKLVNQVVISNSDEILNQVKTTLQKKIH